MCRTCFITVLALAAVAIFAAGCTRTYVGTGGGGVPSPDGGYRLTVRAHGAYGRSYIDRTKKGVRVGIWRGSGQNSTEIKLYSQTHTFVGSDLSWDVQWSSGEEVIVHLYDYGVGVSSYDAGKSGKASNHIATLTFQLDKQSGRFREKR